MLKHEDVIVREIDKNKDIEIGSSSAIHTADTRELKGPLSDLRQFLATESPLKMMKNDFYFILKVLFFLRYLIFILTFWLCRKST